MLFIIVRSRLCIISNRINYDANCKYSFVVKYLFLWYCVSRLSTYQRIYHALVSVAARVFLCIWIKLHSCSRSVISYWIYYTDRVERRTRGETVISHVSSRQYEIVNDMFENRSSMFIIFVAPVNGSLKPTISYCTFVKSIQPSTSARTERRFRRFHRTERFFY